MISFTEVFRHLCVIYIRKLMKTVNIFSAVAGVLCVLSCSDLDGVRIKDPIRISSPTPTYQITKVALNETQTGYVDAGNRM